VQHARKIDVVDEYSFPGQQLVVFRSLDRRTDESRTRSMGLLMQRFLLRLATRGFHDSIDDILITSAAAQISGDCLSNLSFIERAALAQQRSGSDEKSGSAKAALERMMSLETLLQRVEGAVLSETFHGCDFGLIGLDCEQQTRPNRLAVTEYRAATTHAVLAANVRSGQRQIVAQKIGEVLPRLSFPFNGLTVDLELDSL